jgi:hypothetical protein
MGPRRNATIPEKPGGPVTVSVTGCSAGPTGSEAAKRSFAISLGNSNGSIAVIADERSGTRVQMRRPRPIPIKRGMATHRFIFSTRKPPRHFHFNHPPDSPARHNAPSIKKNARIEKKIYPEFNDKVHHLG